MSASVEVCSCLVVDKDKRHVYVYNRDICNRDICNRYICNRDIYNISIYLSIYISIYTYRLIDKSEII